MPRRRERQRAGQRGKWAERREPTTAECTLCAFWHSAQSACPEPSGWKCSQLDGGAKDEQECEEGNEQNAGRSVRCSQFASPQHRYLSIYSKNSERPNFEFR